MRRHNLVRVCSLINFNPRTHVGCDLSYISYLRALIHFNPRTHVGCDFRFQNINNGKHISIHAPTWGATEKHVYLGRTQANFNPRTHVGCDFARASVFQFCGNFNPRTHVGCDVRPLHLLAARGKFQSTHPRGVRQLLDRDFKPVTLFQSTHPRGVRHIIRKARDNLHKDFNPRTHVGCDLGILFIQISGRTFQSTHPRGVRL